MNIPFLSLHKTNTLLKKELQAAFASVLNSNWYILGKELERFEKGYAEFNSTRYCLGTGNGLDALTISLRSLGIGKGDEVIVPSNTYIASWLAVSYTGAKPVPAEPDPYTYNIDPARIEEAITKRTKVIMPVHLYGQACEMGAIKKIAKKYSLYVVEDNAQAQGASYKGKLTGSFGDISGTSFYPGKNIGALGDGGAITTNNKTLYGQAALLRNYGSPKKYVHEVKGYNSRLDEMQASFLSVKLKHLTEWNNERVKIAAAYDEKLKDIGDIITPRIAKDATSVYHLYVIRTQKRDELQKHLHDNGIGTLIHYPVPPHLQDAYQDLKYKKGSLPISEELARTSLSLPIYPGLTDRNIELICKTIKRFY